VAALKQIPVDGTLLDFNVGVSRRGPRIATYAAAAGLCAKPLQRAAYELVEHGHGVRQLGNKATIANTSPPAPTK
jgi:hypothetical protein